MSTASAEAAGTHSMWVIWLCIKTDMILWQSGQAHIFDKTPSKVCFHVYLKLLTSFNQALNQIWYKQFIISGTCYFSTLSSIVHDD